MDIDCLWINKPSCYLIRKYHVALLMLGYQAAKGDPHLARYPLSVAAEAAELTVPTARSWVQKGFILLGDEDLRASVAGATTRLTRLRVECMAVANKIVPALPPRLACNAARAFTDVSDPHEAPGHLRLPGELFRGDALTALCAYPDGTGVVVRVARKTPFTQIFFPAGGASVRLGRQEYVAVLLLNRAVEHALDVLAKYDAQSTSEEVA